MRRSYSIAERPRIMDKRRWTNVDVGVAAGGYTDTIVQPKQPDTIRRIHKRMGNRRGDISNTGKASAGVVAFSRRPVKIIIILVDGKHPQCREENMIEGFLKTDA